MNNLFEIKNLNIIYDNDKKILDNISFNIPKGEIFSILGETGSGKTILAKTLIKMLPHKMKAFGSVIYNNNKEIDLLKLSKTEIKKIRGSVIQWIPQNTEGSLNPLLNLEKQFLLPLKNIGLSKKESLQRMNSLCKELEIGDENIFSLYPHQLSGGMKLRFMIALGIALNAKVLILDEPTKGIDLKRSISLMELIKKVILKQNLELILITHDLNLAMEYSKNCVLLKSGKLINFGLTKEVLSENSKGYAKALWKALPKNGMELTEYE